MAKILYTAQARVTGGRLDGPGGTRGGNRPLPPPPPPPAELGGPAEGTNPEQLFAVGYASCFESALTTVARRQKIEAGAAIIDARASLLPHESRGCDLAVELDVQLPSIDDAAAAVALVETAQRVCPYSNATRGNIPVTLTANGQPVGE